VDRLSCEWIYPEPSGYSVGSDCKEMIKLTKKLI